MIESLDRLTTGAEVMMHSAVLLCNQVAELQAANKAATQRKSYKRKRLQKDRKLTFDEGARLTAPKEFGARSDGKKVKRARVEGGNQPQRRCGRCGETGHNARTCKKEGENKAD